MEYAVIKTGGKQYRVSAGDIVEIDKIEAGKNENKILFEDILLLVNGDKISIGKPNVLGVLVEAKLVENKKGDKIRVSKFKAKSRYRRTIGFRPMITVVQIEKINFKETVSKKPKKVGIDIV